MITDALLTFVPEGAALSLVAGAGVDIASTNTIDLFGGGVGTPVNNIIGTATVAGADTGLGGVKPQVEVIVGTAATTGSSATLNVAFQGAADNGSDQPSTWTTLVETGEIAAASLTAGAIIARFDWPPAFPAGLRPRFLRLLFQVPAATTFTAGTIDAALVTMVRDDQGNKYQPSNFTVA
ncbi:MAG: Bbp16 family capsid cement protein [Hyphomicrobium sp.]